MGDSDGSLAVRPRSSGPSVRARDVRLGWLDVVSAPPGFRRPGFCRGTVPLLLSLYDDRSWDVKKRFKECTPRPGLVISPPVGLWSQYLDFTCLSLETVSGRESENLTTQHYTVDHLALGSMKTLFEP